MTAKWFAVARCPRTPRRATHTNSAIYFQEIKGSTYLPVRLYHLLEDETCERPSLQRFTSKGVCVTFVISTVPIYMYRSFLFFACNNEPKSRAVKQSKKACPTSMNSITIVRASFGWSLHFTPGVEFPGIFSTPWH